MRQAGKHKSSGGVKCITAALGHRRGDKYLFANEQEHQCKSYRSLWLASRSPEPFAAWLKTRGLIAA